MMRRLTITKGQKKRLAMAAAFMAVTVVLVGVWHVVSGLGLEEQPIKLGATFSKRYAAELGLDWRQSFLAAADDLKIKLWRIPAYWTDIEPQSGEFDFSSTDWLLSEISKRDGKVILAVGRKLPRWPECHVPRWAKTLSPELQDARVLRQVEAVVKRYRDRSAIVAWQVENEPFFDFGDCPKFDESFLKREIALVRSLDSRPIQVTESGELSTWLPAAEVADQIGISLYRIVYNRLMGYFYYPLSPKTYTRRAIAVEPLVRRIVVSELQAEPWSPDMPITQMPIEKQLQVLSPSRLRANVSFVRRVGLPEAYLWGVEWWYWLATAKGHPELWDAARELYR